MLHSLLPLIVIIFVFGIVAVVAKAIAASRGGRAEESPYERADLFSPAERSFLGVLEQAVAGQFRVMGKVRLADVVKVKSGRDGSARQSAFNRIQSKHVDFVLCEPGTLSVRCVVELDDKSHNRPARQGRDESVDKILQGAGIPVFRFAAKRGYSPQDIRNALFGIEEASSGASVPAEPRTPGRLT